VVAFLVIGGVGIALLGVSFVAGELLDGVLDGIGGDWLSGAAIAGFLAAFGFGGALALNAGAGTGVAALVGLVAGGVAGGFAGWLTTTLQKDGGDATPRSSDLTGREGTVISAVPADGYGEVSVVVSGHITKLNARGDEALAVGTPVRVSAVLSPTAVQVTRR
jgi:membrane protein implicated in regulation of membrane protease activity